MNKSKTKLTKLRNLELKKETISVLIDDQLHQVVGGNNSTRKSQCQTLCFT